jgi:hypothetical protein
MCGYVPMPCLEAACDGLDTIGPGVESVGSFSGRPARSFTFPELSVRGDHGTRCGNAMLKSVKGVLLSDHHRDRPRSDQQLQRSLPSTRHIE